MSIEELNSDRNEKEDLVSTSYLDLLETLVLRHCRLGPRQDRSDTLESPSISEVSGVKEGPFTLMIRVAGGRRSAP